MWCALPFLFHVGAIPKLQKCYPPSAAGKMTKREVWPSFTPLIMWEAERRQKPLIYSVGVAGRESATVTGCLVRQTEPRKLNCHNFSFFKVLFLSSYGWLLKLCKTLDGQCILVDRAAMQIFLAVNILTGQEEPSTKTQIVANCQETQARLTIPILQ